MYQRKGDLDPETLESQRQRFLTLRQAMPRLQALDSTRSEDSSRNVIRPFSCQKSLCHFF